MQSHASMFYLVKFADSYSHSHYNNCGVCFGSFHHLFALHSIYKMLLAFEAVDLLTSMYKKYIKVYLYMHGSINNFLVL